MDPYTAAWIAWFLMFGVIEGIALFDKDKGDTLSEHFWRWFSIGFRGKGWRLRRFALLAFMAWLVLHFLTGGAV